MRSSTIETETSRRRTFAIISHPDAGKTTLTEKILLYCGAIGLAGAVRDRRRTRRARSDWMTIEQMRGIPWLPRFAPEHFTRVRNSDVGRYKQFRRALDQLDREGVVQVLRRPGDGGQEPVLAAVGPMQFEIAAFRFKSEFDVAVSLEPMSYELAVRTDRDGARRVTRDRHALVLEASDGTLLVAFKSRFWLEQARRDHPDVVLEPLHGSRSILADPYGGGSIVNAASRSK